MSPSRLDHTSDSLGFATMQAVILAVLLCSLLLVACSTTPGENRATRTALAKRNSELATQIAANLQETLRVERRQKTATAVTSVELATQAVYDQQATATAYIAQRATAAAQSTANAQAIQALIESARNWPPLLVDSFDQTSPGWSIGEKEGQTAHLSWTIAGGKYRWHATAKSSALYWVDPEVPPTSDFYLAVEVQQTSGTPGAQAGIVFRASQDSFWCFLVDNQRGLFFGHLLSGDWHTSMPMQLSAVRPNQSNRLEVVAQGALIVFLINGDNFLQVSNDSLLDGLAGLMIALDKAGDQASWEFDNFELRIPPEQLQTTPTP